MVEQDVPVDSTLPSGGETSDQLAGMLLDQARYLHSHAYMLTGNSATADDLVQRTFEAILGRCPDLATVASPRAFLRTTVTRLFLNEQRTARVARRVLPKLMVGNIECDPFEQLGLRDQLWRGLRRLPPRQRAALILRYYDDLEYADIASILGCPPATARSLVRRGLKHLRVDIQEEERS